MLLKQGLENPVSHAKDKGRNASIFNEQVPLVSRTLITDLPGTVNIGRALGRALQAGDFIGLCGDLGAGKTELARAIIFEAGKASGFAGEVPSPTYTLVQIYEFEPVAIWHVDLYRIENWREIHELGLDEALDDAAVLVEWPERLGLHLPSARLDIVIKQTTPEAGDDRREITLAGHGAWGPRLQRIML